MLLRWVDAPARPPKAGVWVWQLMAAGMWTLQLLLHIPPTAEMWALMLLFDLLPLADTWALKAALHLLLDFPPTAGVF